MYTMTLLQMSRKIVDYDEGDWKEKDVTLQVLTGTVWYWPRHLCEEWQEIDVGGHRSQRLIGVEILTLVVGLQVR